MNETKKPQGRKAAGSLSTGFQKVRQVTLDDHTVDVLRRLGKGNLSAGVRKAAGIVRTINKEVNK